MTRRWIWMTLWASASAGGATLNVGPGQTYSKPCQAIAAANAGDTILVDATGNGTYDGDACAWTTDNLTVKGINGRASISAGGNPTSGVESNIAQDKGIFVIAAPNATIESFELSGAVADPSSNNGAGIRHQGTNLTVRDCYIHDNQDGILGSPATAGTGTVLIEFSEFAHNGAGDGYSHNMYIGDYALFTLQYSYSHESVIGHLVKTRALENHIQYNLIADLADGTGSYEVDIPQGGTSYLIGNSIEQSQMGADDGNPTIITYAEESQANPSQALWLVANTVVNDANKGTFLNLGGNPGVTLVDNIFHGAGTPPTTGVTINNWTDAQGDPMLLNQAAYDYHLTAGSPCIGAGVDPGMANGVALEPIAQYQAPLAGVTRDNAHWDIGAFEYDDMGMSIDGGVSPTTSTSATAGATSTTTGASGGATAGSTGTSGTSSAGGSTGASGGTAGSSGSTSMAGTSTGTSGAQGSTGVSAAASSATSGSTGGSSLAGPGKTGSSGCGCGPTGDAAPGLPGLLLLALGLRNRKRGLDVGEVGLGRPLGHGHPEA